MDVTWNISLQGKGPWTREEAEAAGEAIAASLVDRGFQAGLVNVTMGSRTTSNSFQLPDVAPIPPAGQAAAG